MPFTEDALDELVEVLPDGTLVTFMKNPLALMTTGSYVSQFRAVGVPVGGGTPTTPAICSKTTPGALGPWPNAPGGMGTYLARMAVVNPTAAGDAQVHDRIVEMAGLSLNTILSQPVNLTADLTGSNLVARRGASDYSDLSWWMEIYADGGVTGSLVTATVTYDDGSPGTSQLVNTGAPARSPRMYPILPGVVGRYIKSVDSIVVPTASGTVGNFGVTVTRYLANMPFGPLAADKGIYNWAGTHMKRIQDDVCLQLITVPSLAATGFLQGSILLVQR